MVLSNAERQARFRARKRQDALDRIARYERDREQALDWVRRIDSGWRHYCAEGSAPLRDYTNELRAEKVREAALYEEFIALWRRDAEASST